MKNRREFLQTTAIAAAAPIVGRMGLANAIREDWVVFDGRFAASRRFGARAEARGMYVRAIEGDVTGLWLNGLSRRWSDRPVPASGLTSRAALFCLEQLAWDHRMRVVCHVEHRMEPNGGVTHRVGTISEGLELGGIAAAGERWPEFMADALAAVPVTNRRACGPSGASMGPRLGDDDSILHSWVIAPVLSAARASV